MADKITAADVLKQMTPKDINRVAVYLSKQFCADVSGDKFLRQYDCYLNESAQITLALAIWKILWEIREFRQLKTHPEDLLRRCAADMRDYECRGYPYALTLLCRAFARQFGDLNLPRRDFHYRPDFDGGSWNFYAYTYEGTAKQSDRNAHKLFIKKIPSLKDFGTYFLCESLANEYKEIKNFGILVTDRKQVNVVPFDNYDEAALFLAQLVDLLNTDGDFDCPVAAQFIRDTLAQAPVEEMRIHEEEEAKKEVERRERERIQRENEQIAAIARAKREAAMRNGVHVYIFQLDNDTCKIGISGNVRMRITQIESGGLDVLKFAVTQQGFKESKAREIEAACHAHFWDRRKKGEYFRITYDEAKDYLKAHATIYEFDGDTK